MVEQPNPVSQAVTWKNNNMQVTRLIRKSHTRSWWTGCAWWTAWWKEKKTNKFGIKSVNYDGLIAYLIEAVKALGTELEELKKNDTQSPR